jgi:DNA-binding MarR family transcriptional regulator
MPPRSIHEPPAPAIAGSRSREVPEALAGRVGFLLARAHWTARDLADEALAPLGLVVPQFGSLVIIESEGPLSQQELSRLQGCDRTTMVALIDGLESAGFVERRRNPIDRRAYALQITPEGRAVLRRANRLLEAAELELFAPFDEAEVAALRDTLRRLIEGA